MLLIIPEVLFIGLRDCWTTSSTIFCLLSSKLLAGGNNNDGSHGVPSLCLHQVIYYYIRSTGIVCIDNFSWELGISVNCKVSNKNGI